MNTFSLAEAILDEYYSRGRISKAVHEGGIMAFKTAYDRNDFGIFHEFFAEFFESWNPDGKTPEQIQAHKSAKTLCETVIMEEEFVQTKYFEDSLPC